MANFKIYYQDSYFSLYAKLSLDFSPLTVIIISSKTKTVTVKCFSRNDRNNQRHFKGKTIWRTKFGVPSTTSLELKTLQLISSRSCSYVTGNKHNIPLFKIRHTFLKKSFFPSTNFEWNKRDHNIRNSSSFNNFRKSILKFIRPSADSFFNFHNPKGMKLITRLRLGLSH